MMDITTDHDKGQSSRELDQTKKWTDQEIIKLWPQAAGELTDLVRYLGANITSSQLTMAIALADERFRQIKSPVTVQSLIQKWEDRRKVQNEESDPPEEFIHLIEDFVADLRALQK